MESSYGAKSLHALICTQLFCWDFVACSFDNTLRRDVGSDGDVAGKTHITKVKHAGTPHACDLAQTLHKGLFVLSV